jgi:hypothetical protein
MILGREDGNGGRKKGTREIDIKRNRSARKEKKVKKESCQLLIMRGHIYTWSSEGGRRVDTPLSPNVTPCPARRLEWVAKAHEWQAGNSA